MPSRELLSLKVDFRALHPTILDYRIAFTRDCRIAHN